MNGHGIIRAAFAITFASVALASCGIDSEPDVEYRTPDRTEDAAFAAVKPVVQAKCGGCHNGSVHPLNFGNGATFKASRAAARIKAGTMPPSGPLDADSKSKLLAYLEG